MKPKAYIETTIVSYLTAAPSRDALKHAHQLATREWWQKCPDEFDPFTSPFVLEESAAGDRVMAQERLKILATIPLLDVGEDALSLADRLVRNRVLPKRARVDALHIATSVTNGIDFLVTWNCKHLANAKLWSRIEKCCQEAGYVPVRICTPLELLE